MLEFGLNQSQREIVKHARRFAREQIIPRVVPFDEYGALPLEMIHTAFEENLLNLHLPQEYGGPGLGILEQCLVVEEFAAADAGMGTSLYANDLSIEALMQGGESQRVGDLLEALSKEPALISLGITEPDAGSDVAGSKTSYVKEDNRYLLNGQKFWITNASYASHFLILAREAGTKRHKGLSLFIVDRATPGLFTGMDVDKLGHRSSNTAAVILRDVPVSKENLVGEEGEGFKLIMQVFSRTRPVIGAMATGIARTAMEHSIEYAKRRRAFGSAIADHQVIGSLIANMYTRVESMRALTRHAARYADEGNTSAPLASCAKVYSSEAALEVAQDALQIFGGYGYAKHTPVEKAYRDAKLFQIYEGTSQIQNIVIANHMLSEYEGTLVDLKRKQEGFQPWKTVESKSAEQQWICAVCGYEYMGETPPQVCPICGVSHEAFVTVSGGRW